MRCCSRPRIQALLAKAELSAEEQSRLRERARPPVRERAASPARPAPAPPPTAADEAKEAAASAYLLAAKQERFSEARVALRTLATHDKDGWEQAKLADAFRRRADELWAQGQTQPGTAVLSADRRARPAGRRSQTAWPGRAWRSQGATPKAAAARARSGRGDQEAGGGAPEEFKAIPRDPKTSRVAVDRGRGALGRLSLPEAEMSFNLALEADPSNAAAIAGLAEVAFERSRYAEALDYARRAVQQAPRTGRYHVLVGDAYFKLLRYADAKAAYERALRLGPSQDVARSRLERLRIKFRE